MTTAARTLAVFLTIGWMGHVGDARGEDAGSCAQCGRCRGNLQLVCRPVHTTRPEEVVCWDVVDEEICVPRKGFGGSSLGAPGIDYRGVGGWVPFVPSAGAADYRVRPRGKLMRKTFIREVPVIVWVVEPVCADCAGRRPAVSLPSGAGVASRSRSWTTAEAAEAPAVIEAGRRTADLLHALLPFDVGEAPRRPEY